MAFLSRADQAMARGQRADGIPELPVSANRYAL